MPARLGVLVASIVSGRLGMKWSRQRIALGALSLVSGMLILRFTISGITDAVDH